MKRKVLFIGFIMIFAFAACDKEVDLVIPELFVTPTDAGVLDTVTTVAYASISIEGEPVQIDSYLWSIQDPDGNEVYLLSGDRDSVKWVPLKEGDYLINVTINAGNKSVTKTSLNTFKNTIRTFQTALVGEWEGSMDAPWYSSSGVVHFTIEANGHYSAYLVSEPSPWGGPNSALDNGVDEWDHLEKKIIVENLKANGEANGSIKFVHYWGELLTYLFDKMSFSNNYNELHFNSGNFSPENLGIEYKLTRQN
jgi:hypothetical protein